jgi:hypothetical protein
LSRAYARFGILALAIPAVAAAAFAVSRSLWRPRAPCKFPRRRFLLTILVARSLRYYTEGILAVFYGERVLRFLRDNGLVIVTIAGALCLVGLLIYLLSSKGRAAAKSASK